MKTKTMKKALSLFLAVLMIALALPFTLLIVSAETESTTLEIESATYYSKRPNGADLGFIGAYPISKAYDNKMTGDSVAQTAAEAGLEKHYWLDTDGTFKNDYDEGTQKGEYYGVMIVKLKDYSNIKNFNIWTCYYNDSKFLTNDGYDIYYSLDGVSYTLKAKFTDLFDSNKSLYEQTRYDGNYDAVHKIAMDGVDAQYIAIALTGVTKTSQNYAIFCELTVDGTVIDIPTSVAGIQQGDNGAYRLVGATDSLNAEGVGFKLDITHTYEEDAVSVPASVSNVSFAGYYADESEIKFYSTYNLSRACDNDINTEAQTNNPQNKSFLKWYLDTDGTFKCDTDGTSDYYAIFYVELTEVSVLNTFDLWTYCAPGDRWTWNNAYDIYYSADGTTYTAVEGAQFTGMSLNSASADYYKAGTYQGTQNGYVHKIDMNGATAKYVAVAVSGLPVDRTEMVFYEASVDGTVAANTVTVTKTATYTTDATNVVYNSILADGETITAKDIDEARYDENDKLYVLGITGIPQSGTVELEVTPYFIPVGTDIKLYGDAATFEFIDGKALDVTDTVKTMTYNINNGQVNDKIASARLDYIAAQINTVDPDIVLLGEAHHYSNTRYNIAISDLTAKCDVNYGIVEFTEEESTNVILYNKDKFTLLKSEYLSIGTGTTDTDQYARDAVFAKLKRISDNREILAVATHISVSNGMNQVRAILTHVRDNYADVERRIIAGDLNVQSLAIATAQGNETASNKYVHENSFGNKDFTDIFYTDANVSVDTTATFPESNQVIDYIYTTNLNANNYQVLTGGQASNASDHNAVYAELVLN